MVYSYDIKYRVGAQWLYTIFKNIKIVTHIKLINKRPVEWYVENK